MSYKTINTKYITIFFGAFLIGGLLHVALYGIDFFDCISQMYYSAMALVWAVTIQKRVSDRKETTAWHTMYMFHLQKIWRPI